MFELLPVARPPSDLDGHLLTPENGAVHHPENSLIEQSLTSHQKVLGLCKRKMVSPDTAWATSAKDSSKGLEVFLSRSNAKYDGRFEDDEGQTDKSNNGHHLNATPAFECQRMKEHQAKGGIEDRPPQPS